MARGGRKKGSKLTKGKLRKEIKTVTRQTKEGITKPFQQVFYKSLEERSKKRVRRGKQETGEPQNVRALNDALDKKPEVRDSMMNNLGNLRKQALADARNGKPEWQNAVERSMLTVGGDLSSLYKKDQVQKRVQSLGKFTNAREAMLYKEIMSKTLTDHNISREALNNPALIDPNTMKTSQEAVKDATEKPAKKAEETKPTKAKTKGGKDEIDPEKLIRLSVDFFNIGKPKEKQLDVDQEIKKYVDFDTQSVKSQVKSLQGELSDLKNEIKGLRKELKKQGSVESEAEKAKKRNEAKKKTEEEAKKKTEEEAKKKTEEKPGVTKSPPEPTKEGVPPTKERLEKDKQKEEIEKRKKELEAVEKKQKGTEKEGEPEFDLEKEKSAAQEKVKRQKRKKAEEKIKEAREEVEKARKEKAEREKKEKAQRDQAETDSFTKHKDEGLRDKEPKSEKEMDDLYKQMEQEADKWVAEEGELLDKLDASDKADEEFEKAKNTLDKAKTDDEKSKAQTEIDKAQKTKDKAEKDYQKARDVVNKSRQSIRDNTNVPPGNNHYDPDDMANPVDAALFLNGQLDSSKIESVPFSIKDKKGNVISEHKIEYLKREDGKPGLQFNASTSKLAFERVNSDGKVIPKGEALTGGEIQAKLFPVLVDGHSFAFTNPNLADRGSILQQTTNPKTGDVEHRFSSMTDLLGAKSGKSSDIKDAHNYAKGREARVKKMNGVRDVTLVNVPMRDASGKISNKREIAYTRDDKGNVAETNLVQPLGDAKYYMKEYGLSKESALAITKPTQVGGKRPQSEIETGVGFYFDESGQIPAELRLDKKKGESIVLESGNKEHDAMRKRIENVSVESMAQSEAMIDHAIKLGVENAKGWAGLTDKQFVANYHQFMNGKSHPVYGKGKTESGAAGLEKKSVIQRAQKYAGMTIATQNMLSSGVVTAMPTANELIKTGAKEYFDRGRGDLAKRFSEHKDIKRITQLKNEALQRIKDREKTAKSQERKATIEGEKKSTKPVETKTSESKTKPPKSSEKPVSDIKKGLKNAIEKKAKDRSNIGAEDIKAKETKAQAEKETKQTVQDRKVAARELRTIARVDKAKKIAKQQEELKKRQENRPTKTKKESKVKKDLKDRLNKGKQEKKDQKQKEQAGEKSKSAIRKRKAEDEKLRETAKTDKKKQEKETKKETTEKDPLNPTNIKSVKDLTVHVLSPEYRERIEQSSDRIEGITQVMRELSTGKLAMRDAVNVLTTPFKVREEMHANIPEMKKLDYLDLRDPTKASTFAFTYDGDKLIRSGIAIQSGAEKLSSIRDIVASNLRVHQKNKQATGDPKYNDLIKNDRKYLEDFDHTAQNPGEFGKHKAISLQVIPNGIEGHIRHESMHQHAKHYRAEARDHFSNSAIEINKGELGYARNQRDSIQSQLDAENKKKKNGEDHSQVVIDIAEVAVAGWNQILDDNDALPAFAKKYGTTLRGKEDHAEAFAENGAMYTAGVLDYMHPDMIEFYNKTTNYTKNKEWVNKVEARLGTSIDEHIKRKRGKKNA